jgi:predicted nucleotidyltransferase
MITHSDIVQARKTLLERTVAFFTAQDDVLGIFLGGSIAAGTSDTYSDIDLRVIATPEGQARLLAGRLEWPAQWGDFLFNEWLIETQVCVSHFRPFTKMDVFYWTPEMFKPSPWFKLPTTVFLDRTGVIRDVLAASRLLPFAPPEDLEVSRILSKALATVHETVRRARRQELFYAQSLLEQSRAYIMQLDTWLQRWNPEQSVDLKMHHRLSPALMQVLERSYVGFDANAVEAAVIGLTTHLRQQIPRLHEAFHMARPMANDLCAADIVCERQVEGGRRGAEP